VRARLCRRFSARGVQKHHKNIFVKSPCPCRKPVPKKTTNMSMSVFPRLFLFYRVFGRFSAMGFQKYYKKHRVGKFLQKNRPKTQNPKPIFFLRPFQVGKLLRIGLGANSPVLVPSTMY
jgi:hypothetical protein